MNTRQQFYEPQRVTENRLAIKTMNLEVAVTEPDLKSAVQKAFNLAKSGGMELNIAFSLGTRTQENSRKSDTWTAGLTSP